MSNEKDFEQLTHTQRLKAAVHHTSLRICREHVESKGVKLNRLVVASISEATWRKCEDFATDLECFAKHAKRSTINADDVKMIVRRSPKLLQHITNLHEQISVSKGETKKKKKTKNSSAVNSNKTSTTVIIVDDDSRS